MARKLPGLQRVLDVPSLAAVAYGEIASSLYFALGIVAAHALGFTPLVLLGAGIFFLIVSLSYAEGTAAIPETGGAATFVRRAFNDVAGFLTGWALFLDYLIVIALSSIFLPHYLGTALGLCELSGQAGMEQVCLSCMAYVLRDFGLLQTRDAGPRPGAWLTLGGIGDDRYRRHPPIDDVHIPGRTAPRSPPAIA